MNNFCLIKYKNNIKDTNAHGSVPYNFLMSQSFISCEDYVNFLNAVSIRCKDLNLYNQKISKIIDLNKTIYTLKDGVDSYSPIRYINLENIKIYCNYLNSFNLKSIDEFPYNINTGSVNKDNLTYWVPTYDEWYKSAYFDYVNNKYWAFPHGTDNMPAINEKSVNTFSPYGLINAGFKFFTIIDQENEDKEFLISGGSSNRHPIHAKSGTTFYVSKNYYSNYISSRICKKSDTKKYILKLYDTFGDGWGDNYIIINDANHKPLTEKLSISHGYGPVSIDLEIDTVDKNFNINYYKNNQLSYENYYELYDESNDLVFSSTMHETPPKNTIVTIQ